MKKNYFPWSFFITISLLLLGVSAWLSITLLQQESKAGIEQSFTSMTERLRGEFATIIALEDGLVANIFTLNNIQRDTDTDLKIYINTLSAYRDDISFFMLPKISASQLTVYEHQKQEEGYLNFHIFGNPEIDPMSNNNSIYFPTENIKQNKITGLKHLGRDIYSYSNFHDAIDEAVQKNKTVAAWSHVTAENEHGTTIFHPIYDTNFIEGIPENQRMDHVQAMVATEFFLDRLIKKTIEKVELDDIAYTIGIHTYRGKKQPRTTYIEHKKELVEHSWLPVIQFSKTLALLDKPITISLEATPDTHKLSWFAAMSVWIVSAILLAFIYLLIKQYYTQRYEREQSKRTLQQEHDRAETTLTSLGEGVMTTDKEGRILYLNPKACEILEGNGDIESLQGQLLLDIYPLQFKEEAKKIISTLTECINNKKTQQLPNIKIVNKAGMIRLLDCTISPMRQSEGLVNGAALVLEDVTHLEDMRLQIENLAKRDHLTGLFNRYEFENQIKKAILDAHTTKLKHAFCYLDLDQFKLVNDTAGHMAGDQLLRQLSGTVFLRSIPKTALLGRLGGDEFGLLLFDVSVNDAVEICTQLIQDVQHFIFLWRDKRFQVGVSIGLVIIDESSLSVEQTLISADTACYLAKEKGRNRVEFAHIDNAEIRQRHEELTWAERIPRAIEENRLVLFIQYMLPLKGVYPHAEVLVRMKDEDGKLLSPDQFIPAAERYGLMVQVDRWIIKKSIQNIELILNSKKNDGVIYGLNLSGQSLTDEKFLLFLHAELSERPQLAQRICFEITETAAMGNLTQALQCMKLIKDLGCSLALDDFGSGLSSFAYLRHMPVDYLKIDGAFVHNIHKDSINRAIVANMHQLAMVFSLKTIAEYVENDAILEELKKIGINLAQGYAVHVPEAWLIDVTNLNMKQ